MAMGRPTLEERRVIAEDKTAYIALKLPSSLKKDLADEAEKQGLSLSAYLRLILANRK